jgi:ABC-type Fe3+ transport system permease subunit
MTLPVVVWSLWLSGGLGTASALTLILLVMMLPVIGLYWYVSRKRGLSI